MAVYKVQGPDGAVHRFEGPDDATPEQVTAAAAQQFGSRPTASAFPKGMTEPATQNPFDYTKYPKTGDHLSIFDSPEAAQAFATDMEAGMQKEAPPAPKPEGAITSMAKDALAIVEGAGKGAFNVGGIIGERVAPGYTEAREERLAARPTPAMIGNVGGNVGAGAAAVGAASLIPGAAPLIAPVAGARLANAVRYIGTGAALGGTQAGSEGEDIATGAVAGGVAGPLAAVAAARGIASAAGSTSARSMAAMRWLGGKLKLSRQELEAKLNDFAIKNARQPSISDVLDLESRGALREAAADAPAFGAPIGREVDRRAARPPQGIAREPGQATDVSTMTTVRKERMDAAMKPIENKPVPLTRKQLDALAEPDVYETLPRSLKRKIQKAKDNGVPLTLRDIDNMRMKFSGDAAPGEKARFREYAKDMEALGASTDLAYVKALDDYRADSNAIDAFEFGLAGKAPSKVTDEALKKALASPEGGPAYATGVAERTAAENLQAIAPSHVAPEATAGTGAIAHGAAAAVTGGMASRVYHLIRAIPGIRAQDKTLQLAAKYLYDPTMAAKGVAILKKAGASDAAIAQVVAATTGSVTGAAAGGAQ